MSQPTPQRILDMSMAYWSSKTLLSAVELGVFTALANGPQTAENLRQTLGLHPRSARDFLDALVAMGMLERTGDEYRNTVETGIFLDRNKPSYVGGILEMSSVRLYQDWGGLTQALRTGAKENAEVTHGEFDSLYETDAKMKQFLSAMTGLSRGPAQAMAAKFPWKDYKTAIDIGTAQGATPVEIARAHEHLTGGGFDLAKVRPVFEEYVAANGLQQRLKFYSGDFFTEPLPSADVLIMGHILHDWGLADKMMLLKKAYDALPSGGVLIVYEALIDDERRKNAFGLLMSLNMLIETKEGFDFTGADCMGWMKETGFKQSRVEHLLGPDSMAIGIK